MSCSVSDDQLKQLKIFVDLCRSQPQIIHLPQLAFFKEYLSSLGVNIPTARGPNQSTASGDTATAPPPPTEDSTSSDEETEESDVELNMEGVIEPDLPADQVMGDPGDAEISEAATDRADELRSVAMAAFSDQKLDEAIKLYTEAIVLNPRSALLFAKRGQAFLKQNKPNACIKDCSRALEINCDSAAAYKFRGRAYRLLGQFEEAANDLSESLKIDYDDQVNEWFQEVKPNAEKLRQHKLSQQRKKAEKERRDRVKRARKAQEARARAAEAQAQAPQGRPAPPQGRPAPPQGRPAPPQGDFMAADFSTLMSDPEVLSAFQDPEVSAAFRDVSMNPANFAKYQNNPKIAAVIEKLQHFNGRSEPATFPGSAPGTHPDFCPTADDDVGLD